MERLTKLLTALSETPAVAGQEGALRDNILSLLPAGLSHRIDPLGNLIVTKSGKTEHPLPMLLVNLDSVGLLVQEITPDGLLRCEGIGIDPLALHGRLARVGQAGIPAAIGAKAWHRLTTAERDSALVTANLYLDIGATTQTEAAAVVALGDAVTLTLPVTPLGEDRIVAPALEAQLPIAVLLELLAESEVGFTAVFAAGGTVGQFGAMAAAHTLSPKTAVVLGTIAADSDEKKGIALGKGVVLSHAAGYDGRLVRRATDLAVTHTLPHQLSTTANGDATAQAVLRSGSGIETLAVGIPCRYRGSGSAMADRNDADITLQFLKRLLRELAGC